MHTRTPCQQAHAIRHATASSAARAPQAVGTLPEHERQRCEVWTRVMGYHRPTSEFNAGKQSEHRERRHFIEPSHRGTHNQGLAPASTTASTTATITAAQTQHLP